MHARRLASAAGATHAESDTERLSDNESDNELDSNMVITATAAEVTAKVRDRALAFVTRRSSEVRHVNV